MIEVMILPVAVGLLALCAVAISRMSEQEKHRRPVSNTGGSDWTPSTSAGFWGGDSGSSWSGGSDSCSFGGDSGGSCGGDGGGGGGGD
jgi:hypothetical protein